MGFPLLTEQFSFLLYSLIKRSETREKEVSIDCHGFDYITRKQLLVCVKIIMKHTNNDVFACTSLHHQLQNNKITHLKK